MIIDTHAHYDDEAFDADREELLSSLAAAGIGRVIDVGSTRESLPKIRELTRRYPFVYGALGLHPDEVGDLTEETFAATLLKAVNLGNDADTVGAVAGGLAGLHYGYENIPAEWLEVTQRREWIESLCVLSFCKAPSSPQHSPE